MLFQIVPTHFNPWLSCFCIHYCTYLIKEHPYWDGSMNILNESNDFGCSQVKTAVYFQWKNGNIKNSINCKYCILSSVALAHLYPRRNNPSLASGSRKPELLAVQHGWDGCWTWVSSLPYWRLSHMYLTLVNSAFWNIVHPLMFTPFLLRYASEVVFLSEVTLALLDAATDKDSEVQEQVRKSILTLGKQQPDRVLAMCQDYLLKHPKVTTQNSESP